MKLISGLTIITSLLLIANDAFAIRVKEPSEWQAGESCYADYSSNNSQYNCTPDDMIIVRCDCFGKFNTGGFGVWPTAPALPNDTCTHLTTNAYRLGTNEETFTYAEDRPDKSYQSLKTRTVHYLCVHKSIAENPDQACDCSTSSSYNENYFTDFTEYNDTTYYRGYGGTMICGEKTPDNSFVDINGSTETVHESTYSASSAAYNCTLADLTYEYACVKGYYLNGTDTCQRCPYLTASNGNKVYGDTEYHENDTDYIGYNRGDITSCIMSKSYNFTDETGIWHFIDDCDYSY